MHVYSAFPVSGFGHEECECLKSFVALCSVEWNWHELPTFQAQCRTCVGCRKRECPGPRVPGGFILAPPFQL